MYGYTPSVSIFNIKVYCCLLVLITDINDGEDSDCDLEGIQGYLPEGNLALMKMTYSRKKMTYLRKKMPMKILSLCCQAAVLKTLCALQRVSLSL